MVSVERTSALAPGGAGVTYAAPCATVAMALNLSGLSFFIYKMGMITLAGQL